MGWIGVNQSGSMDQTLESAKRHLLDGRKVRIEPKSFTGGDKEHAALEYEVYVLFD